MTMIVNEHCRNLARVFNKPEPVFHDDCCSLCGSVSLEYIKLYLQQDGEIEWIEPLGNNIVEGVRLANGKKFLLRHKWDEPHAEEEVEGMEPLLESYAGNLQIYLRELNKYFL